MGWQATSNAPLAVGPTTPSELRPGQTAVRATYSGSFEGIAYPVEGEVTAVQGTDVTVIFDAWAGFGELDLARAEIERMIGGASIP